MNVLNMKTTRTRTDNFPNYIHIMCTYWICCVQNLKIKIICVQKMKFCTQERILFQHDHNNNVHMTFTPPPQHFFAGLTTTTIKQTFASASRILNSYGVVSKLNGAMRKWLKCINLAATIEWSILNDSWIHQRYSSY